MAGSKSSEAAVVVAAAAAVAGGGTAGSVEVSMSVSIVFAEVDVAPSATSKEVSETEEVLAAGMAEIRFSCIAADPDA